MKRGDSFSTHQRCIAGSKGSVLLKASCLWGDLRPRFTFWLADSPGWELKLSLNVKCSRMS